MHFYCYSAIDESSIATSLGEPDYSYYFVLKAYQPLLDALGTWEIVAALDDSFAEAWQQRVATGTPCYVLAFAPPHKIPRDLPYRVIPVFAWEYSTLPSKDVLGEEADCWVSALAHFGTAICHSTFARDVVLHDVGPQVAIESIPAPLWDSCAPVRERLTERRAIKARRLAFSATVIDTQEFNLSAETLFPREGVLCPLTLSASGQAPVRSVAIDIGKGAADVMTVGLHPPEGWGAWTRADNPWVLLPGTLSGRVRLTVAMMGFGPNEGREILLHVGDRQVPLVAGADMQEHQVEIEITSPTNFLRFSNIDHSQQAGGDDTRVLGIGLGAIGVEQLSETDEGTVNTVTPREVDLDGVVYTSIFNPRDGRKNWEDMLTAFCYAFRAEPKATLILKMTCKSASEYLDDLFDMLCQLHPFDCRVVILHGFLESEEFSALLETTSYVVNASRGEGQCLPLMEFMSSGIPAIAPVNTAMADYVTPQSAFIVDSTPEPTFWPHENSQLLTTWWHRPSWESLFNAYLESYRIGRNDAESYTRMASSAAGALHQYCSIEVLAARMQQFLASLDAGQDQQ
ncbi:MAG: hypothetical protein Hals2KO_26500 [Halioglobus sp.]